MDLPSTGLPQTFVKNTKPMKHKKAKHDNRGVNREVCYSCSAASSRDGFSFSSALSST